MGQDSGLVVTVQYQQAVRQWETLLDDYENVSIIFPHLSDRQFRLNQWSQSLDRSKYFPIFLHFSIYAFDESADFHHHLISHLPPTHQLSTLESSLASLNRRLVMFVVDGESLFLSQNYRSIHHLQATLVQFPQLTSVVIGFESNPYDNIHQPTQFNKLFQNVVYYPLYSDSDMGIFIDYLSQKWKLPIPVAIKKSIINLSGGFFWLAKEACRVYRDTHQLDPNASNISFRISELAKAFTVDERSLISLLPVKKNRQSEAVYQHLSKLNHFDLTAKLRIVPLQQEIQKLACPPTNLVTSKNAILLRGVDITQTLSQTEFSLLQLFLTKPNQPLSRDELAKVMWPHGTDDKFSAWAIDQAVKRLRDRLVSLQLPPTTIRSVRGIGYEYRI